MVDERERISIDADEESARRAAEQLSRIFQSVFSKAASQFAAEFRSAISDVQKQITSQFDSRDFATLLDPLNADAERLAENVRNFSRDLNALKQSTRARRDAFAIAGLDPSLLATYERQLERLVDLEKKTTDDRLAIARDPKLRKAYELELAEIRRALIGETTLLQSTQRDITATRNRESLKQRQDAAQASRERLALIQKERSETVVETQRQTSIRLAQYRAITRAAEGTARTISRVFGRAFTTVENAAAAAFRVVTRQNQRFDDGLQSSLSRRETIINNSFRDQERIISRSVLRQQQTLQRFENAASTGVAGALTGRSTAGRGLAALGFGFAGGVAGAALLSSGLERFSNLERLQKQFEALTGSVEDTALLLDQIALFAKETPFDLVGVADLAKGFLAIGTATEDVLPNIRTIADAVAFTGGGVDALNRIQRAIGQIVSTGRLQGDELNQLAENLPGINIRQLVADRITGGNVQDLVKLQESGDLSADLFLDAFLTGLSEDTRLQGASEDLAKTLSGRLANLKESFADFGASLIGLIADPLRQVVSTSQQALQGLADFIRGDDLSGALDTLRTAAGGAAIAIGALLVARAAGEAIRFLAIAVRSALTPFGLLVAAVAAVGAAVAVLSENSPEFREALAELGETVLNVLAPALEFVRSAIESFVSFLTTTVIPALGDFAVAVAQRVGPVLETIGTFISERVLPAVGAFMDFITGTAVPALVDGLAFAFGVVADAARAFWGFVEPILQPAIDGFKALGEAVVTAVTEGDIGALVSGFRSLGSGIVGVFQNIGQLIVDTLRPVFQRVLTFFRDFFSGDNLKRLGLGFLDLVEEIGFILSNIVTDRRVVTALAAIAAAAAAVAVRFIQGLARGILDNLPDLADAIRDLAVFLVSEFIDALFFDPTLILATLTAAFLAPRILGAFRRFGADGAKSFATGFFGSIITSGRQSGQFLTTLFGGRNAVDNAAKETARRTQETLAKEFNALQRRAGALGLSLPLPASGVLSPSFITNSERALKELSRGFTDAQRRALELRSTTRFALDGIATAAVGVKEVFTRQFDTGFKNIRNGAGALRLAITDLFAQMRRDGIGVGQALGNAILSGVGAALAGQQLGTASSGVGQAIGLGGIISSALFAGLSVGGGAQGVVVGSLVAGLGAITAAVSASGQAAQKAKDEINEYVNALKGVTGEQDRIEALAGAVQANFSDENERVQQLLIDTGFTATGLAEALVAGTASAEQQIRDLLNSFGASGRALFEQLNADGEISFGELEDQLSFFSDEPVTREFIDSLNAAGFSVADLKDALDFLGDESGETRTAFEQLTRSVSFFGENPAKVTQTAAERLAEAIAAARDESERAFDAFKNDPGRLAGIERLQDAVGGLNDRLSTARDRVNEARDAVANFFTEQSSAETARNRAIVNARNIGSEYAAAFAEGITASESDALSALALENFDTDIQNVVFQAIQDGLVDQTDTQGDIFKVLTPLSTVLDELLKGEQISQETRDALGQQIADAITDTDYQAAINGLFDAESAVERLQAYLDTVEVELGVKLVFKDLEDQLRAVELGLLSPAAGPVQTGAALAFQPIPAASPAGTPTTIIINESATPRATAGEAVRLLSTLAYSPIVQPNSSYVSSTSPRPTTPLNAR